jgi:hypothetical protein
LQDRWIDRNNLLFTWKRNYYNDGTQDEEAIIGSHIEATAMLLTLIQTLIANTPGTIPYVPYNRPTTGTAVPHRSSLCSCSSKSLFSMSSSSSSSGSPRVRYITQTNKWRALTLGFDDAEEYVQIFIINDFEGLYADPLNSGTYKYVNKMLLERNWIDREDLMFVWQRKTFNDGTTEETPLMGSQQETSGALKQIAHELTNAAP